MKVVILAGGFGTRISEESHLKPKPMIEIGMKPILWHIMKLYSHYGHNDFIICCGYKGFVIKEYFSNYYMHSSDITFDFSSSNKTLIHNNVAEPWKVTLVDTGAKSMTGGRIKRIQPFIEKNETFMMTYGDGVSNVNIDQLLSFHRNHDRIATLTAVQPSGKFGALDIGENNSINSFVEKPKGDGFWINGGFFVLNYEIFNYIDDDSTIFEETPLKSLSANNQLMAFKHYDFWQPMDTMRDKEYLEQLWKTSPPWKVWDK